MVFPQTLDLETNIEFRCVDTAMEYQTTYTCCLVLSHHTQFFNGLLCVSMVHAGI